MSIERRVKLVEKLFDQLDLEISEFQKHTKLGCVAGCGKCCSTPDIDASPLEFLPWAFHLFVTSQAEVTWNELKANQSTTCTIYRPLSLANSNSGSCGDYKYRGLICRLFGFGANTNKYGQLRLATCKIIKEDQKERYDRSTELINNGLPVPIFTDYYMNLSQIDFRLGNVILPINEALQLAIEEVLNYYAYRPMPNGFNNCA